MMRQRKKRCRRQQPEPEPEELDPDPEQAETEPYCSPVTIPLFTSSLPLSQPTSDMPYFLTRPIIDVPTSITDQPQIIEQCRQMVTNLEGELRQMQSDIVPNICERMRQQEEKYLQVPTTVQVQKGLSEIMTQTSSWLHEFRNENSRYFDNLRQEILTQNNRISAIEKSLADIACLMTQNNNTVTQVPILTVEELRNEIRTLKKKVLEQNSRQVVLSTEIHSMYSGAYGLNSDKIKWDVFKNESISNLYRAMVSLTDTVTGFVVSRPVILKNKKILYVWNVKGISTALRKFWPDLFKDLDLSVSSLSKILRQGLFLRHWDKSSDLTTDRHKLRDLFPSIEPVEERVSWLNDPENWLWISIEESVRLWKILSGLFPPGSLLQIPKQQLDLVCHEPGPELKWGQEWGTEQLKESWGLFRSIWNGKEGITVGVQHFRNGKFDRERRPKSCRY